MPKLSLRCNYLKNAPASHLSNFICYIGTREGVEKVSGTTGNLPATMKQQELIQDILTKIEDAERLGYDSAVQWQELIRSMVQLFAENYKIDSANLKWYAAFHNESHHPPIQLVVYSTNLSEGFLTNTGIETMRLVLAHDIFRQDFMSIYQKKTEQRDLLKEQAESSLLFLMEQMRTVFVTMTDVASIMLTEQTFIEKPDYLCGTEDT